MSWLAWADTAAWDTICLFCTAHISTYSTNNRAFCHHGRSKGKWEPEITKNFVVSGWMRVQFEKRTGSFCIFGTPWSPNAGRKTSLHAQKFLNENTSEMTNSLVIGFQQQQLKKENFWFVSESGSDVPSLIPCISLLTSSFAGKGEAHFYFPFSIENCWDWCTNKERFWKGAVFHKGDILSFLLPWQGCGVGCLNRECLLPLFPFLSFFGTLDIFISPSCSA